MQPIAVIRLSSLLAMRALSIHVTRRHDHVSLPDYRVSIMNRPLAGSNLHRAILYASP